MQINHFLSVKKLKITESAQLWMKGLDMCCSALWTCRGWFSGRLRSHPNLVPQAKYQRKERERSKLKRLKNRAASGP